MPRGNPAVVVSVDLHVAGGLRRDRAGEVFNDSVVVVGRYVVGDGEYRLEGAAVNGQFEVHTRRHPNPRAHVLQEARAEACDVLYATEIDDRGEVLALIALPRAGREIG